MCVIDICIPSLTHSPKRCRSAHACEICAFARVYARRAGRGGAGQRASGERALDKSTALYGREKSNCSNQQIQDRTVPGRVNFTVL